MIWTNRVVFSNALRCFQNINSFFGLFWFLCTSIYRPCVVQTNQAQVNEVLEYNVRAVSRLFSDREAPSLRCHWFHAFHDWLEQCFNVSKLEQVWMHHLFNLVDLDSLQPLSDVPSPGWTWEFLLILTCPCVKLLVAHVSSRFSLSFAVLFLCVNLLLCLSLLPPNVSDLAMSRQNLGRVPQSFDPCVTRLPSLGYSTNI